MMAEAARNTVKWPFRWVSMTASHSSSAMLNSIRSRRIPATATTPSIRPHRSTPAPTMRSPPARVVTLSATATASPPAASISATTASATSLFGSSPAIDTPMSATTTVAPSAAEKLQAQQQKLAQFCHAIFNSSHLSAAQQQSVLDAA